jgi:hypothetical protein
MLGAGSAPESDSGLGARSDRDGGNQVWSIPTSDKIQFDYDQESDQRLRGNTS